jgi:hypothetical protein
MFSFTPTVRTDWNLIIQHHYTIFSVIQTQTEANHTDFSVLEQLRKKALKSFIGWYTKLLYIIFFEYITHNDGTELLTWQQVKKIFGKLPKSPTLMFYKYIKDIVINRHTDHQRIIKEQFQNIALVQKLQMRCN